MKEQPNSSDHRPCLLDPRLHPRRPGLIGRNTHGGWVFRDGLPPLDHFRLGTKLDTGVLRLGRKTWELFSHIWPSHGDDFSAAMNRMRKPVAWRTGSASIVHALEEQDQVDEYRILIFPTALSNPPIRP